MTPLAAACRAMRPTAVLRVALERPTRQTHRPTAARRRCASSSISPDLIDVPPSRLSGRLPVATDVRSQMQVAAWERRVPLERMRSRCRLRALQLRCDRDVERVSLEPAHLAGWEAILGLCEHVCAAVARHVLQLYARGFAPA